MPFMVTLLVAALTYHQAQDTQQLHLTQLVQAKQPVTMIALGDIMLGRYVETLRAQHGDDYPFVKLDSWLGEYDSVFGNLEGPIDDTHNQTPNESLVFSFTPSVAELLAKHHFSVLSVANNHSFDQGAAAYELTRTTLQNAGIAAVGNSRAVGNDYAFEQTIRGHKFVWLGYCPFCGTFDKTAALTQIAHYAADPEQYVIVSVHWGNEYQTQSSIAQQQLAHDFIAAGADLILGHHPHVTQEIEVYQNRLIVYSLGNFIFDQYFSTNTQTGLAVELQLTHNQQRFQFYGLTSHLSQPELMTGGDNSPHEPITLPY